MIAGLYKIFDHWHEEGTLFIFSDPHFGDDELTTGIPNRPTAAEIVRCINAKCGRKDTLICLGDVGDVEYVRKLRAKRKVLIMGNHDAGRTNYERQVITQLFSTLLYTKEMAYYAVANAYPGWRITIEEERDIITADGFMFWKVTADNMLFDEVYEGPLMIAEKLILSHEPVDVPWAYNIHGHDHQGHKRKNHTNVCVDVTGYQPINMNQWMKSGAMARVETIHRDTIDKATVRARKRTQKKGK